MRNISDAPTTTSEPARFSDELSLPIPETSPLGDVRRAINEEFLDGTAWKRLRCRGTTIFAERKQSPICLIEVGHAFSLNWTWEGAKAIRPVWLDDASNTHFAKFDLRTLPAGEEFRWSGEVLAVDQQQGHLFIDLEDVGHPPTTGAFFIQPYEFLRTLDDIYRAPRFIKIREKLPARLAATRGAIPRDAINRGIGLPHLQSSWQRPWCVLWGPPGTGKTYTIGQQVARVLEQENERVLVVSTTNTATDAVATEIGKAVKKTHSDNLRAGTLARIGSGVSYRRFMKNGLTDMLAGIDADSQEEIDALKKQLSSGNAWDEEAFIRKRIRKLYTQGSDPSSQLFVNPKTRVVVSTAFKAMKLINDETVRGILDDCDAPFTTIIIDEAGLISRAAIAALSLLASRRVVLVGDSKQLAPISRINRILPTAQNTWLARSGLSHLNDVNPTHPAVHLLKEQHRMHPDVCQVVSKYQYGSVLKTAEKVVEREPELPSLLNGSSRAIWYVLDDEPCELAHIRADRGPGNQSWTRAATLQVLEKLFADDSMKQAKGLFIAPFKAQTNRISDWFKDHEIENWQASTVHSQQGTEADIVIFDTVNAGSTSWPPEEWKRLVNVALSRAKEAVIVLASRTEMNEPYLRPLASTLSPYVFIDDRKGRRWASTGGTKSSDIVQEARADYVTKVDADNLGGQIARRKAMHPVASQEQERLCGFNLDGKPRLVRGVAGSGKSYVLANWLARTAWRFQDQEDFCIWAVYANKSLDALLRDLAQAEWERQAKKQTLFGRPDFPHDKVKFFHVRDLLADLLPKVDLSPEEFKYEYDQAAEAFLDRLENKSGLIDHAVLGCDAIFIDEAQDMGPATLKVLLSLVKQTDPNDKNSRSAHIFYDNAQNIYGRGTPRWSEFGIDMRGRSVVMKESYRSTNPIVEFAVNVFDRIAATSTKEDQRELLNGGLLEAGKRDGEHWLKVRYNQVGGAKPIFEQHSSRAAEMQAIAKHLKGWIQQKGVSPEDICLIYNGNSSERALKECLGPEMKAIGVELSFQTSRRFERRENTLLATTAHSYKGYESEFVLIPCADQFVTRDKILAQALYVAMTRARSCLAVYSVECHDPTQRQVVDALEACSKILNRQGVEEYTSEQDDKNDILQRIGQQHRKWLDNVWKQHDVSQEPIFDDEQKIVAQPLLWFCCDERRIACVEGELSDTERTRLRTAHGVIAIQPGESWAKQSQDTTNN